MQMGRVFHSDGSGNASADGGSVAAGWYYQVDLNTPHGPFDTKPAAVAAAREDAGLPPLAERKQYLLKWGRKPAGTSYTTTLLTKTAAHRDADRFNKAERDQGRDPCWQPALYRMGSPAWHWIASHQITVLEGTE